MDLVKALDKYKRDHYPVRLRTYYDGKLIKSTPVSSLSRAIQWLDNTQADWSRNLMPQVQPGEFDPNNGSEVIRESETELFVITTGGHKLRFIVIGEGTGRGLR